MGRKLGGVKPSEVRRLLRRLGFELVPGRGKGSHEQYRHPGTGRWTTLSWKGDVVPTGTLKRILDDAGLTTEEFLDLL
jgi:predicted RNA binding protein YcfA (HicA-like mRNA interferase family)